MSGWEMTKGSFSHSGYNAKIHKSTNSWDNSPCWICKHEGFKTYSFSSYFEAILKVERRVNEHEKIQKKIAESDKTS